MLSGRRGGPGDTPDRDAATRHSVVPARARRSAWPAAVWTGLGAAVVCATMAIVVVALCWLPAAGSGGHTNSAIRAGLLTFLASVHGGLTIDGVATSWLPLGMLGIVGVTCYRAGSGLGDALDELGEQRPARLVLAGLVQAATFTTGALVAVPFATLGTSRAPLFGVGLGAFVLFCLTGGVAFVRASALRAEVAVRTPAAVTSVLRAGAAAVAVYLIVGACFVAGALVLHHTRAEALSRQLGGGLTGLPVALLGVLAAPNAAIGAAGYLAGPGVTIGSGTSVSLFGTVHGLVPAFPLLAALPTGTHTAPLAWAGAIATPFVAAFCIARMAARRDRWWQRFATAGCAALSAGLLMLVLAWQGGGAAGDGRLATVGVSPWQLGGAVAAALAVLSGLQLGAAAAWQALFGFDDDEDDDQPLLRAPRMIVVPRRADADTGDDADSDRTDRDRTDRDGGSWLAG